MGSGTLFAQDFLLTGIRDTDDWRRLDEREVDATAAAIRACLADAVPAMHEANTETLVIFPIFDALGWGERRLVQGQLDKIRRLHVPDAVYFASPTKARGRTFHAEALERGKDWEESVRTGIADTVFGTIFPRLLQGLKAADRKAPDPPTPAYLAELREAVFTLLYCLLFTFYAEDRGLIPITSKRADDYSFRRGVRDTVERRLSEDDTFSRKRTDLYDFALRVFEIEFMNTGALLWYQMEHICAPTFGYIDRTRPELLLLSEGRSFVQPLGTKVVAATTAA